ncbi:MAG: DUF4304 domain-containing protein [Ruminococcaceae bacterium]|nr:DUF4304 domain-containing protein [Oscillospiraceae bacterium]
MLTKEQIICEITPLMRELGFKKRKTTWYLCKDDITVVFNIQNSQYDRDAYYINLGTNIKKLNNVIYPSISSCCLWQRIDVDFISCSQIVQTVKLWIAWYGSIEAIRSKVVEKRMPMTTKKVLYEYISTLYGHIS